MRFVNVGFNNILNADRIVAVIGSDSAPSKRLMQDAKDMGRAIDCTSGRKTRSILVMDSDHVVLSAIQPETLAARLANENEEDADEDEEENA
ncbi:MAG: DUF370 domain-containing protein [Ruminococcaceae bacterium]|nr:DUF370 domain-containing protein [Oscillospiraceae bacterium]